jgi:ACR3 family arsenite efflux pump ArsB
MATHSITGIGEVERRELIGAGLRAALSTGVLLAAYYLLPITHVRLHGRPTLADLSTLMRLSVAFAIFIAVLVIEIRAITKAKHPMLRAGVAMAVVIPLFLLFFAWTYLTMWHGNPGTFNVPQGQMTRTTALYFTVTIFSTVGFGDITPHTDLARIVTTVQMLADLAVIAVVIRLILGAATRSTAERQVGPEPGADRTSTADSA